MMKETLKRVFAPSQFSVNYTDYGLDYAIQTNKLAKAQLNIELSKRLPNWDGEAMRGSTQFTVVQEYEVEKAINLMYDVYYNFCHGIDFESKDIRALNSYLHNAYVSQKATERMKIAFADAGIKISMGLKSSRAMVKFWDTMIERYANDNPYWNEEKLKNHRKLLTQFCDCFTSREQIHEVIFSTSLLDFVTMSEGNSWSSCHSISDEGCHMGGTLSLANDKTTFLVFEEDKQEERCPYALKLWRKCYHVANGYLVQNRHYGGGGQFVIELLEQKIAELLGKLSEQSDKRPYDIFDHGTHSLAYGDFCGLPHENLMRVDGWDSMSDILPLIGAAGYCMECTEIIDDESQLHCSNHCYKTCEGCGEEISGDDYLIYNGDIYCYECCTTCTNCDDTVHRNWVRISNDGEPYCEYCYTELFAACEECGEEIERDEAFALDGRLLCECCYDDMKTLCVECGDSIEFGDELFIDCEPYCSDCYGNAIGEDDEEDDEDNE